MTVTSKAVSRWVNGYVRAWQQREAKAAASLFAEDAVYSSHPFRPVQKGRSAVLEYTIGAFDLDEVYEVRFGKPVVEGTRAAVEYWGIMKEDGKDVTIAGSVMLRLRRAASATNFETTGYFKRGRFQFRMSC